ncbi:hypothetical protein K0M31_007266, partial [Melipona bicolor]
MGAGHVRSSRFHSMQQGTIPGCHLARDLRACHDLQRSSNYQTRGFRLPSKVRFDAKIFCRVTDPNFTLEIFGESSKSLFLVSIGQVDNSSLRTDRIDVGSNDPSLTWDYAVQIHATHKNVQNNQNERKLFAIAMSSGCSGSLFLQPQE